MPEHHPLPAPTLWQLAQINVGHALAPLDDPRMAGFTGELDALNALAEHSDGFVWRLQDDSGNATTIQAGNDPLLMINMSVWQSVNSLEAYVYSGPHLASLKQRRQWFRKPEWPALALWWVPAGHIPSVSEGMSKLELLRQQGPNPQAFSFASRWPAPEAATSAA